MNLCKEYAGEVIVDNCGCYLGDFRTTDQWQDGKKQPYVWPRGFTALGWSGAASSLKWRPYLPGPHVTFGPLDSYAVTVVNDTSGPPGLEAVAALRIEFSGLGSEGVTFMGTWPASDGGAFDTGWNLHRHDCYTMDVWVKAVPDSIDGYVCAGYDFSGFKWGNYPYDYFAGITLDGTWQHYLVDSTYDLGDTTYATLTIGTITTNGAAWNPKGAIHLKCLHVYPCGAKLAGRYAIDKEGLRRLSASLAS